MKFSKTPPPLPKGDKGEPGQPGEVRVINFEEFLAKAEEIVKAIQSLEPTREVSIKNIQELKHEVNLDGAIEAINQLRAETAKLGDKEITVVVNAPAKPIEIILPKGLKPKDAIPVVLTDKSLKKFYDIIADGIKNTFSGELINLAGAGGNSSSFPESLIEGDRLKVTFDTPMPVKEMTGLVPEEYDYISLSYTGANLTGVVYKTGGSGGTTVATLVLGYSGSVLTTVERI